MKGDNNQFLGKKKQGTPDKIFKVQETDKNKKTSIAPQNNPNQNQQQQQNNPNQNQQQNNPNQAQPQQIPQPGTQTNQTNNQQQPQQGNQNQQKSPFDEKKFDKQNKFPDKRCEAINEIYANALKNTFFSSAANEGTKYSNSLKLLNADYNQKMDKINKTDDINTIKDYLLKCEKRNCNGDKTRENECINAIGKLTNKNAAICYVRNKHQQNVNSLQENYKKQQSSFIEKANFLNQNQCNAIFFNSFNADKEDKSANVAFEDCKGDKYEGTINLEKLRDEQAIYGTFKMTRSSPNNDITNTITGDLIDDKQADYVLEIRDKKEGTIYVVETKKGKQIKRTTYESTDRTGSKDNIDATVDEIDEKNNKRIHKFYSSRQKEKDGTCNLKTDKYSYFETDLKGMIHVPEIKEIGQDKKVVLYSMMNDADTKSRMQMFKKKYEDKIQLIDTEVVKDAQDNTKASLQFKNDDSKLEIGKNQTKLDIFLLKHGAYHNFQAYELNLDVIIKDIEKALRNHPNQIEEIYIKNYSCYNGLIDNNKYKFFDRFAEMIQKLIKDGQISPKVKVATSCPRNTDSETMRQTTDGKGKYGVRAISIPPLHGGENELNLLAIETNKVIKENGRGRVYQMLNVNKQGECKFKTIAYHKFCTQMNRGTFQKKDHKPNYYNNSNRTSINQVQTPLQIDHTNTITIGP